MGRSGNLFPGPSWGVGVPLGSRSPGPVAGLDFGPFAGSISWSLRGLEFRDPRGPISLSFRGPNFFSSLRGLNLLGSSVLDVLGPSGPRLLGPSGPRFLGPSGPRFLGPSGPRFLDLLIAGLVFFVHSGARFCSSIQGLDFFFVLRGLDFLVRPGLNFLFRSGARFFFGPFGESMFVVLSGIRLFLWSFRGLDFFFGPSGARFFMIPFGDPLLVPSRHDYYRHLPMLRALGGLVSLGLSVLSLFGILGLSILTGAQAHCSCLFRRRCG